MDDRQPAQTQSSWMDNVVQEKQASSIETQFKEASVVPAAMPDADVQAAVRELARRDLPSRDEKAS